MVHRNLAFLILLVIIVSPASAVAENEALHLELRTQVKQGDDFAVVNKSVDWKSSESAIIVVDMWNDHHCKSAADRVVEMTSDSITGTSPFVFDASMPAR